MHHSLAANVSVGSFSEVSARNREVRFTPTNRHRQFGRSGPKSANHGSGAAYSITSAAPTRRDGGIVRPSALAVLMLMTKSRRVGP